MMAQYSAALQRYLSDQDSDTALHRAREFGRQAVRNGVSILTITRMHDAAVGPLLARLASSAEAGQLTIEARRFLAESLAPYEVAQREFQETTQALHQRTEELTAMQENLERRIADRTAELRASLQEKEVLLKEIHHRVKNNLQIISSLLSLQARYVNDTQALTMFKNSQSRIKSMALVHEQLYQSPNVGRINMRDYFHRLAGHLGQYRTADRVTLQVQADEGVSLGIDTAIPCALIMHELVLNALQHAFPGGQRGEIVAGLQVHEGTALMLSVRDTGKGLAEDFDPERSKSLGLRLVHALTEQLGGALQLSRDGGTAFRIRFSESRPNDAAMNRA